MSEDDERCYDEQQAEDTEAETINHHSNQLPLITHPVILAVILEI